MKHAALIPGVILLAAALASPDAQPQARGPSWWETRESGQNLAPGWQQQWLQARQQEQELDEQDRIALLDPAVHASRTAELEVFLRRLSGRFRIDGEITSSAPVALRTGVPEIPVVTMPGTRTGAVTGIADCIAIGDGVGVNCIFSASWPIIDNRMRMPFPAGSRLDLLANHSLAASEQLQTMRPAVLVIGLTADPLRVRAMMVTADTLSYNWSGKLEGDSAKLKAPIPSCFFVVRCYLALEILARPDSEVVSFILQGGGATTVTLTMHREPR